MYNRKIFLEDMSDLHIKYPVIIIKQLIPVFPHAPNISILNDDADTGDSAKIEIKPELTT